MNDEEFFKVLWRKIGFGDRSGKPVQRAAWAHTLGPAGGARGGCRTCRAQASREEGAGQGLGPEILSQTLKGRFVLFSFCTIYFLYYIVNMYIKMHI